MSIIHLNGLLKKWYVYGVLISCNSFKKLNIKRKFISLLNLKALSVLTYFLALFSNIFVGFEDHFRVTSEFLGIEGLLFGWLVSKNFFLPWFSNLIYWYLILLGKYFNFLRVILSLAMIVFGLFIFDVNEAKVEMMMDRYYYELTPTSGIYLWLGSYILLAVHYIIGDWKLYRSLLKY